MPESIRGRGDTLSADAAVARAIGARPKGEGRRASRPSLSAALGRLVFAAVLQTRHTDPTWLRYLSGLALWILSFGVQLMISRVTPFSPFLLFIPGLMLVAWLWGRGPALLYLLTTAIGVSSYFVPAPGRFSLKDTAHVAAALQFIVVGVAIMYMIERLLAARRALRQQLHTVRQLSAQQQTLLEEINHRVKNHLQAIIALTPPGQGERLDQIRTRVLVLARVYDKLSLTRTSAMVDAETYMAELTSDFQNSLALSGLVKFDCSVSCGPLHSKEAVFVGLIANESVSNALKYAFPDGHGKISISLVESVERRTRTLLVQDDGVGDGGTTKGTGQGRRLISRLARELGGEFRTAGPPGHTVNVTYPSPR